MSNKKELPDYSNWVPQKLLILLWSLSAVFAVLLVLAIALWSNLVLSIIFGVITLVLVIYSIAMQVMHNKFSFTGGNLMGKVHEYLLGKLDWNGKGKLIDIGCGSGALAIKAAKTYPEAEITGLDYWGAIWNYAKEQCENNAKIEGVTNTQFIKGDASELAYDDGTFDAATSNFVFHEVRTVLDKRKLVREALRVVKKGGSFAFHDLFEEKRMYGKMDEFIAQLKNEGITEIHYEPHTENLPFVPGIIKPMFKNMGLLYGKK